MDRSTRETFGGWHQSDLQPGLAAEQTDESSDRVRPAELLDGSRDLGDLLPMSRFLLHILAAFAELEREMIRERVVAGIRAARIKGISMGRPKRVFPRDEARLLRANGLSYRKIAAHLGVPFSTIIDACRGNGNQA